MDRGRKNRLKDLHLKVFFQYLTPAAHSKYKLALAVDFRVWDILN